MTVLLCFRQKKLRTVAIIATAGGAVYSFANVYMGKQQFYDQYMIPAMQKLDPEFAHKLTIWWFKYGIVPKSEGIDTPMLVRRVLFRIHSGLT